MNRILIGGFEPLELREGESCPWCRLHTVETLTYKIEIAGNPVVQALRECVTCDWSDPLRP